jgi:hypothetical protein
MLMLLILIIFAVLLVWYVHNILLSASMRREDNLPEIVFVLGKGGVGKSTYSQTLSADTIISIDDIVRPWDDSQSSDDDYAFNVYRPGGNEYIRGLKKKLSDTIRSRLKGKTVIEGVIEDVNLIRDIAVGHRYSVVYLRPATMDVFKKAMIKRVNEEYALGVKRLGRVWNRLSTEELIDYETNGAAGILFSAFMNRLARDKYLEVDSTLPLLAGLDYHVVNVSW